MPADITEDVLEENICKALSLTGVNVVPNDLHACHRLKRTDRVIVKFKCCKQKNSVMYKRKILGNKSKELSNLKFSGRLFVTESISMKINSLRINADNSKVPERFILPGSLTICEPYVTEHGKINKIFHVKDI